MLVNGDQRYIALVFRLAKPLDHPRLCIAAPALPGNFGADQIAASGIAFIAAQYIKALLVLAVGRHDLPAAAGQGGEHTDDCSAWALELLDDAGFVWVGLVAGGGNARQNGVTGSKRRCLAAASAAQRLFGQDQDFWRLRAMVHPLGGLCEKLAIAVHTHHTQNRDWRQTGCIRQPLAA
jgi:hypothetical protein